MGRRWLLFGVCLLAFSTAMWGQLPGVPGTDKPEHPQHTHRHDRRVNFGIKGGFTSSLFLVSDLVLNGTVIDEVQNNYKIGYFGSFFMRIHFKRHFLQPELSYTINGYNIIKEGPYSLAVFGGPKIRYIWDRQSKVTFENFDQRDIEEELYPLNVSLTAGVAVTISRIFFDFRYDIGLHNISKRISYKPVYDENAGEEVPLANQIRFHRRENVLSFSFGVFF